MPLENRFGERGKPHLGCLCVTTQCSDQPRPCSQGGLPEDMIFFFFFSFFPFPLPHFSTGG